VSSTSVDSREPEVISAQELLIRLERYAAAHRAAVAEAPVADAPVATAPTVEAPVVESPASSAIATPAIVPPDATVPASDEHLPTPRRRLNPATADLFPYDLTASIVGCAATIMAYISFGRPIALALTAVLLVLGVAMRGRRWFPSVGVNLIIGTVVGLIFVLTA
jgi:hypothetical protein